jgi:A/G-specific adenine glycosylase
MDLFPGFDKPLAARQPLDDVGAFRDAVVEWFDSVGRHYPWRATTDPYAILVSELMLQQTRIETVLERRYFERWMEQFPDVAALAVASDDQILKAWEGLGYYRRARHLRETARRVMADHGGTFPMEPEAIRQLPGVGDYTAGAVLAFAYDRPAAMIDGNVARVLARLFDFQQSVDDPPGKRQLQQWSERLVDPDRARRFQSGLMEIGQRICRSRQPVCWECPVAEFCLSRNPEALPVKRPRVAIEEVDEHIGLFRDLQGRIFLCREEGGRRAGLWRLPLLAEADRGRGRLQLRFAYPITRYRVNLHVYEMPGPVPTAADGGWFGQEEVEGLALASPYRRALERLRLLNGISPEPTARKIRR